MNQQLVQNSFLPATTVFFNHEDFSSPLTSLLKASKPTDTQSPPISFSKKGSINRHSRTFAKNIDIPFLFEPLPFHTIFPNHNEPPMKVPNYPDYINPNKKIQITKPHTCTQDLKKIIIIDKDDCQYIPPLLKKTKYG